MYVHHIFMQQFIKRQEFVRPSVQFVDKCSVASLYNQTKALHSEGRPVTAANKVHT
jgi:hypothetical protein